MSIDTNTLSRSVTASLWLQDATTLEAIRHAWRRATVDPVIRARLGVSHYLLYAALRGRDWRKSFPPLLDARKIENGEIWHSARVRAVNTVRSAAHFGDERAEALLEPFGGTVTLEMLRAVAAVLPGIRVQPLIEALLQAETRAERHPLWDALPAYSLPEAEG